MALTKLLLTLLPTFIQICTTTPLLDTNQEIVKDEHSFNKIVRKALKKSDIIPDVLNDFHPTISLSISYPSAHKSVDLGNAISPSDVQSAPAFELHSLSSSYPLAYASITSNATYTLILTDPDATSRSNPKLSEICHWIATNITLPSSSPLSPISASSSYKIQAVDELISYLPPSPPPKTGKHRYVFVLLAGPEGTELTKPEERPHWGYGKVRHGVRDWAEENGLAVVGANFFYSKNKKQ